MQKVTSLQPTSLVFRGLYIMASDWSHVILGLALIAQQMLATCIGITNIKVMDFLARGPVWIF